MTKYTQDLCGGAKQREQDNQSEDHDVDLQRAWLTHMGLMLNWNWHLPDIARRQLSHFQML